MTSSKAKMWLAFTLIFISFFLIFVIICVDFQQEKRDIIMVLIGFLNGIIAAVVSYYFGSSSSSAKKSETIDTLMEKTKTDEPN